MKALLPLLPQGPYHASELCLLARMVALTKGLKGDCLEVGSLAGRSAGVIGTVAKRDGGRLYCIDIWDSGEWATIAKEIGAGAKKYPGRPEHIYDIFKANMERLGLSKTVVPIVDRSEVF